MDVPQFIYLLNKWRDMCSHPSVEIWNDATANLGVGLIDAVLLFG